MIESVDLTNRCVLPSRTDAFTRDVETLGQSLVFSKAEGNTALYDAIGVGLQHGREGKGFRKVLLVISDGGDNRSRLMEQELVSGAIRRLVINLSLTILPDVRRLPYIWFDNRQWPSAQLSRVTRALAHIEEGLRLLFESLYAHGALIVAAAGNDSMLVNKQGQPPQPPRAPAPPRWT